MPATDDFRRSLRASRARRAAALRSRRLLRGRGALAAVTAGALALSGGAIAHERSDRSDRGAAKTSSSSTSKATIKAAQRALGVTADGVVGPQTRRAARRFQRKQGLTVDGVIGPQTLRALGVEVRGGTRERTSSKGARGGSVSSALERIAQCESGGDPTAISSNGRYRGKYQFRRATWRGLGGEGDPAKAPESEQDRMAAKLYERSGPAPWPACSRKLGLA